MILLKVLVEKFEKENERREALAFSV